MDWIQIEKQILHGECKTVKLKAIFYRAKEVNLARKGETESAREKWPNLSIFRFQHE